MNNYMIFFPNIKVPLLSRNNVWKFKFNGLDWQMSRAVEQLMAFHLFANNYTDTAGASSLLQANYKRLDPFTIEALISYFKKTVNHLIFNC